LADLLEHCAGLAAHREYFTAVPPFDAARVLHHVIHTPREYPRRERVLYSDLGFMILGAWLERVLDLPLDEAFADRVAYRLGLDASPLPQLGFRRLQSRAALGWSLEKRIAPTEVYDPTLCAEGRPSYFPVREIDGLAHGAVHDDNAFVMGGVAGHAGLFGTAVAVATIAQAWLDGTLPGVEPERSRDVVARFTTPSTVPGSTRRLGFDGPEPDGSGSTGGVMSSQSFGHLGFTGTSVWIDPVARSIHVLLSNRVHPTRHNLGIRQLRPAFHRVG
ncbi:MAG: serine hydrolase, partial [Myxococcales bacterium]|nr:serine hydrolase [Myxococcales bacterium]